MIRIVCSLEFEIHEVDGRTRANDKEKLHDGVIQ